MNGQDLYIAGIINTPECVWWDNMTLKQYKRKNTQPTNSKKYAKLYATIAANDYTAIKEALRTY